MPRLKKLVLHGFKSFADPATFLFPTGITAVVGPNGSGKSNIVDAIRWVLGEQRMTAIRGRTGEDMIFAGTRKRARSGMARAAITFDNEDGWLPVDFAEITVERRTYRDGTSDYILNGNKVRLMDLRDLLDRGGLGRDAYLVIGQGLVDQVLSLRPQERLALFEQAAGITPYRTRREDAVDRLEDTRHNLQRVYDIVGEIEPRLRRLKRQAEKATEYERLDKELTETLRLWYGYRWGEAVSRLEEARRRVVYREEKALALIEGTDALTAQAVVQRQEINEQREALAQLHRASSAQHDEAGRRQRELVVAQERQRQLHERIEESEANLIPLRSARASEVEDIEALEAEMEQTAERLAAAQTRLKQAEAAHAEISQRRHALLRRQAELQSQALETRHRVADRQSRLEQAEARAVELVDQTEVLAAELAEDADRRREQQQVVADLRTDLDQAEAAAAQARAAATEAERTLEAARAERDEVVQAYNRQEAQHQRMNARLEALDRLHNEGAGLYAGVRAVLSAVQRGQLQGLPGPISSLLRVPSELERAVETALGSQLQNVVAERWEDAQAAIDWLKKHRAGRATFLPLDALRPPSPLDLPGIPGVIGVASDLVRYDERFHPAVLLLLGRTAVAETLDAARQLHRKLHSGFRIVTLDGEIVRSGGSVTGGESRRDRGPGLLSRERERRELRRETGKLRKEIHELKERGRALNQRVKALVSELDALREQRQAAARHEQQVDREVDQAVRSLERVMEQITWRRERLESANLEQARVDALIHRLRSEVVDAQEQLASLEAQLTELGSELHEVTDDRTAREVAERRTDVAVLEQEYESQKVLLESRQREATRLERQIAGQEHRIRSLNGEIDALAAELTTLTETYRMAQAEADALSGRIPPLETRLAEMEEQLSGIESREQASQRALREAEQRLSQAEVDFGRRQDRLQGLHREVEESLGIVVADLPDSIPAQQPLPLDAIVSPLPSVTELPKGLEGQIRDLRTQIRRVQPVNPAAKEEYDELAERHAFLREQMEDLEQASSHLRQVIGELDEMMDTMFSTTFKSIASEFERVFGILFNGGSARLNLIEGDDDRAGVEISARPPGKRTSNLSMLSGGERSLTAVALLFAVMRVSPTPFCVLDEVDAMLDEANVGRFRRMLGKLSQDTQFLIITHNRGTVEVADTIYGVSMGADGVSAPLSLSLEDLPVSEAL